MPSVVLINKETGKPELFDSLQKAKSALDSDTYSVRQGDKVAFTDPETGTKVDLSVQEALRTLGGPTLAPVGDVAQAEEFAAEQSAERLDREFGISGAAALGAARGLTLGGIDAAARAGGEADVLREVQSEFPISSLAGEVAGSLVIPGAGTLKAGGTAAKAGASLAAPSALARGLAGEARKRVLSAVGSGTAGKATAALAEGAIEGALFGAGQGLSNAALSDKPFTAEAVLSEIGSSALYGSALGGGIGAGGSLMASGLKGVSKKMIDRGTDGLAGDSAAAVEARRQVREIVEAPSLSAKKSLQRQIDALEEAVDSVDVGAQRKQLQQQIKEVDALDKRVFKHLDIESFEEFDDAFAKLSQEPPKKVLKAKDNLFVALSERNKSLAKFSPDGEFDSVLKEQLDTALQGLDKKFGITGLDAIALADAAGVDITSALPGELGATADAALKLYLARHLLSAGKAGSKIGAFGKRVAQSAASQKTYQAASNRFPGLAAGLAGASGSAVGAAADFVGKAGGMASKFELRMGKALQTLTRAASKAKPAAVPTATSVLGKVRFDVGEEPTNKPTPSRKAFKNRMRELSTAMADPEVTKVRISNALMEFKAMDPALGQAMEQHAFRKLAYLHATAPRVRQMGPFLQEVQPDPVELNRWAKRVAVAEDPIRALNAIAAGRLSPEEADALREVHPAIWGRIQQDLMTDMGKLKQAPFHVQMQISTLFDIPLHPLAHPKAVQFLQQSYAVSNQPQQQRAPSRPMTSPEPPTTAQKLSQ